MSRRKTTPATNGKRDTPDYRATGASKARYGQVELSEAIARAKLDALRSTADVTVWDRDRVAAVVKFDPDRPVPLTVTTAAEMAPKPRPYRYSNQRPMLRQSITFNPPWEPECPLTIELILLPSGTGGSTNEPDVDRDGIPMAKGDLRVLEESGWQEFQETAVTAFVRFIR
jgi:hypothetical protein